MKRRWSCYKYLMLGQGAEITMTSRSPYRLIPLVLALFLAACGRGSGSPPAPPAAGGAVAWRLAGTVSAETLNKSLAALGLAGVAVAAGSSCYKLTYATSDVSGTPVNASGLVCLPGESSSGGNPVVSFQHGTIFQDREAPSNFLTSETALAGAVLGGLGYIAVLPDYLGYGDSTERLHPYLHAATLASTVVDMNRAARVFLADPAITASANGRFFLAGYSEGAFATLAAQRFMEQSLSDEFPITASEAGAGPYDLAATAEIILGQPNQPQPAFAGFFLKSYDALYNAPSRLAGYVSDVYAGVVDTHFDGSYSKDQIDGALGGVGVKTDALFNATFLADFLGSGEATLKAHIAENEVYDWRPSVPTRLFHGADDEIVPLVNMTNAQAAMERNGSTSVTAVLCDAGTAPANHENCIQPFLRDMISFFQTMATGT